MLKILHLARYSHATWAGKLDFLATQPDLALQHICPAPPGDEQSGAVRPYRRQVIPIVGHVADPHRAFYRTLTFSLRHFRPDLIHAEEEPDSLAALQLAIARRLWAPRAKLLLFTWQNLPRPRRWYVRAVMQAALQASDGIQCGNMEAATVLRQMGYQKAIAVIPQVGVDINTFRPRASPPSPTWTIGYVGRLVAEKGLDTLVAALAAWSERANVQLCFVGAGPQRESLQAQAQASGLAERVKFLPPMPAAAVARFMNSLSVFVLPSRTTRNWKEQFGRVLTEAMACQVPVIGSDSGAIPEVIGDAGLIFPEGNAAGLAECLHRLYTSPDLCRELAERGFVRVQQHYTQAHVAIQTAEFYRQLMTR